MATPFDPATLEPGALWSYFGALSRIPRESGNEAAVIGYLQAEASRLGLAAERDATGNLLVRKPAAPGREAAPITALQGHVDMVCEKNAGTEHDFASDPIRLMREGDRILAQGTTLGADNGIGVAAALAVMAARDLAHGPLEMLFTVDEERGLKGAVGCRPGWLKASYLLNLDGEDASQLCISCAGGLDTVLRSPMARIPAAGEALRLAVGGLRGGHSGVDIHLGRANAIRVLARVLDALLRQGAALAELRGGSRRNVLAREASALLVAPGGRIAALRATAARLLAEIREELGGTDPDLRITLEPTAERPDQTLAPEAALRLVDLLAVLPHGVRSMSPDIPGLVQTSSNLAVAALTGDQAEIQLSHRGSRESEKLEAGRATAILAERFGFQCDHGGAYPGWKPDPGSALLALAQRTYRDLTGTDMTVRAIHAGLECGILGDKHPGLQMLAFGPGITDAHSPQEQVSIASVQRFWDFTTALLTRV